MSVRTWSSFEIPCSQLELAQVGVQAKKRLEICHVSEQRNERILVLPCRHHDGHAEMEAQMHFHMGKHSLNIFLKI